MFFGDLSQVQTIYTNNNYVIINGLINYGKYVAYDIYGSCGTITACGLLDEDENECPDVIPVETKNGCDSVIVLDFTLIEPFSDTIHSQIYKGMTYRDDNFEESEGGTYEKVFTDINGCDSMYVLDLEVLQLKFPNTVTANGDGINDVFEIYGLLESEIFDDVTLIVYNRYGKQIFEQKKFESKADFWDPAANNTPTGTYFYRFIAKGKQKNLELTGVVEVFR